MPPPHSSLNNTLVPSLLKVAECQYAKFGSITAAMRFGFAGSLISRSIPFPEHAPAAMLSALNTVMSWHMLVCDVVWVPGPCVPPFHKPRTGLAESAKMRGELTIRAFCGAASGTLMTSILNRDVVVSVSDAPRLQPVSSDPERTGPVPET